jgi:hypothetical protein
LLPARAKPLSVAARSLRMHSASGKGETRLKVIVGFDPAGESVILNRTILNRAYGPRVTAGARRAAIFVARNHSCNQFTNQVTILLLMRGMHGMPHAV